MIDLNQKKKEDRKNRVPGGNARNRLRPRRSWTIRNKMVKQQQKKNLVAFYVPVTFKP
jgi:hypothetical protein